MIHSIKNGSSIRKFKEDRFPIELLEQVLSAEIEASYSKNE